uniref:Aldehyde dehydrogenase domain-containing protein n=1 Tax=Octactis speculum TaxID=3111310 RepID=A0A7S2DPQ1_9STRA|mmetsp:Transcript_52323/g.71401  ORF Transcript_52323/g.71401 Transcript_52323/m.71401 type:complete len:221 (-) Transcript_52323:400-1062(-)
MVGIFLCTGQVCSATSRLLLHESVRDQVLEGLVDAASRLRIGDPLDERTQMGPCVSPEQRDKVLSAVAKAQQEGCTELLTNPPPLPTQESGLSEGYYIRPHILLAPTRSALWKEEVFGPVLAVSTFTNDDEAVALANDSPYGLAHAVMSTAPERLQMYRKKLRAGVIWENCNQPLYPTTPFGGVKQSGFGREYGLIGLEEYVTHKTAISAVHGHTWSWYG